MSYYEKLTMGDVRKLFENQSKANDLWLSAMKELMDVVDEMEIRLQKLEKPNG